MKVDIYINLENQTGLFRLELVEMLERYCFYVIEDKTAYIMIHKDHLNKINLSLFPEVETVFGDILGCDDSVIIGINNFKRTYDLLLPFIERKIQIEDILSSYEINYMNYIKKFV
jgi:hypothetical protein